MHALWLQPRFEQCFTQQAHPQCPPFMHRKTHTIPFHDPISPSPPPLTKLLKFWFNKYITPICFNSKFTAPVLNLQWNTSDFIQDMMSGTIIDHCFFACNYLVCVLLIFALHYVILVIVACPLISILCICHPWTSPPHMNLMIYSFLIQSRTKYHPYPVKQATPCQGQIYIHTPYTLRTCTGSVEKSP